MGSVMLAVGEICYFFHVFIPLAAVFLAAEVFYCLIMERRELTRVYRFLLYDVAAEFAANVLVALYFLSPNFFYPGFRLYARAFWGFLIAVALFSLMAGACVSLLLLAGMLYRRVRGEPFGVLVRYLRFTVVSALLVTLTALSQIVLS